MDTQIILYSGMGHPIWISVQEAVFWQHPFCSEEGLGRPHKCWIDHDEYDLVKLHMHFSWFRIAQDRADGQTESRLFWRTPSGDAGK